MFRLISQHKFFVRNTLCKQTRNSSQNFLSGSNANYIDDIYREWKKDNSTVHKSWDLLFRAFERGDDLTNYLSPVNSNLMKNGGNVDVTHLINQFNVNQMINNYTFHGHLKSTVDPLNNEFNHFHNNPEYLKKLKIFDPNFYNLTNLNEVYEVPNTSYFGQNLTLGEIIEKLNKIYCSNIGLEFGCVNDHEKVSWLKQRMETRHESQVPEYLMDDIVKAVCFEEFLAKKFPAEKRFGLEGLESLIPLVNTIIDTPEIDTVIMGMAHRGRLNVLANICQQPLEYIFSTFQELESDGAYTSDVKYHLGVSRDISTKSNHNIKISLLANPSHLEAVNPVVKGRSRAEQIIHNKKVLSILIHGDAAFAGQGVVAETINLSELKEFAISGTVHIITNNQIGFTTNPECSRSSFYCTQIAKISNAPILHVNADCIDSVYHAAQIARDYRNLFKKDIIIDLIGYRRNGHNEGDNAHFTQPLLYKKIASNPNILQKLHLKHNYNNLEQSYNKSLEYKKVNHDLWIESPWSGNINHNFCLNHKDLKELLNFTCMIPDSFTPHQGIKRLMSQRLELIAKNQIDWALGEIAAFGVLLTNGIHVRLSGQDAERGTFSHRHHVIHDINNDNQYNALNNLDKIHKKQELYALANSPLSEYAVLGYEYGYSLTSPRVLSIWESQFGDFSNNAQVMIDQFIVSGEDKWVRQSGLVMLLPHGYDGQGPEHSSARLERYLQLSKDSYNLNSEEQLKNCNIIVANISSPANFYHVLIRQMSLGFRKPLIIMSPKNLLRHPLARSTFDEVIAGKFERVIINADNKVKKLVFCSGKIYYELLEMRKSKSMEDVVGLVRIEQISPFPFKDVKDVVDKFGDADLVWCQEEPENQGAFYFVDRMMRKLGKTLKYAGRDVAASPATGSKHRHNLEQQSLLNKAFEF